jgi:hypothetical protein
MYDRNTWNDHPHRNPAHRPEGRKRWKTKVLNPTTGKVETVQMRGPRNPSRWLPHQGVQEAERRRARMEGRANG